MTRIEADRLIGFIIIHHTINGSIDYRQRPVSGAFLSYTFFLLFVSNCLIFFFYR